MATMHTPIRSLSTITSDFLTYIYIYNSERYCVDPPAPRAGGLYDWNSTLTTVTPYLTDVTYTCDIARRFENGTGFQYDTKVYECQWNQSWTPDTSVSFKL